MAIELEVNGRRVAITADPSTPLLWVLREDLHLNGTKFGCGAAQCGACTVHVDGQAVRSCVRPLGSVAGRKVTTIEGASGKVAEALLRAWTELEVPQCGYCQTGQIMSAEALLRAKAKPTDAEIDACMGGNACRCATYVRIRKAIHRAAELAHGGGR
jgi:isoquinoline 1-oxidoreductase alpha subunit